MTYPSEKCWKVIEESMFHITLNANDFFGYACADAVELCSVDFRWVFPLIDEFGHDGLSAAMAYIEDCQPIEERITEDFKLAFEKIKNRKPLIFSKISEWPKELLDKVKNEDALNIQVSREEQKV